MRHVRVLGIAALFSIAASCSSGSNITGGGGGGGACSGMNTTPAVCNFFFSPANSTITAGTMITWTFKGGSTAHNVTFLTGPVSFAPSANMATGTFSLTFNTPGTYTYECSIHGFMGSVTVN